MICFNKMGIGWNFVCLLYFMLCSFSLSWCLFQFLLLLLFLLYLFSGLQVCFAGWLLVCLFATLLKDN